jgi:hypothetical protein
METPRRGGAKNVKERGTTRWLTRSSLRHCALAPLRCGFLKPETGSRAGSLHHQDAKLELGAPGKSQVCAPLCQGRQIAVQGHSR